MSLRPPLEFAECFAMLDGLLEEDALIQPGLDFYRDAYLAKELGKAREAEFIWPLTLALATPWIYICRCISNDGAAS